MTDQNNVRVRFAPSPTGTLHIGSVRTALFNWVFARHFGGQFVIRIEDTDLQRSKKEFEDNILDGLSKLGLDFDEPITRQSERIQERIYEKYALQLIEKGAAYYCFDTTEELDAEREEAKEKGIAYKYSRRALKLTPDQVKQHLSAGDPYTIRFKIPEDTSVTVDDIVRGPVTFDMALMSDFIILKSDGSPAYNFAVVVDDMSMNMTHIIRGEDHISNTPRQILIYEALGAKIPKFAHLPMILGPDRSKLSKRHGAQSVSDYLDQGYLPDALINYLSLLGWSPPDEKEVLSREELISLFKPERISKSGAIFDVQKLKWMNGQWIRKLTPEALQDTLTPYLSESNRSILNQFDPAKQNQVLKTVQDNLEELSDINDYIPFFDPSFERYQTVITELSFSEADLAVLSHIRNQLTDLKDPLTPDTVDQLLSDCCQELNVGKGKVFKPVRKAASAKESGPDLPTLLSVLGQSVLIERFNHLLK